MRARLPRRTDLTRVRAALASRRTSRALTRAPRTGAGSGPLLSVIVIVYDMPHQAVNTVATLSPTYQGLHQDDYEVIVVENSSRRNAQESALRKAAPNVRYLRRDERGVSPAAAINVGLAMARGELLCLMVDGARMVSPGVLRNACDAYAMDPHAVVAVPGYHLGAHDHADERAEAHDEDRGREILESVPWRKDGYRLFDIAIPSGANPYGYLHPLMESNCIVASRDAFAQIGGADERFDLPGGGALNLDIYRRLVTRPSASLVVLPGEGSFHQFHGGVTTKFDPGRADLMARFNEQYQRIRGEAFMAPAVEPILLGRIPPNLAAVSALAWSAREGRDRFERFAYRGHQAWGNTLARGDAQALTRFPPAIPWKTWLANAASDTQHYRTDTDMDLYFPPSLSRLESKYVAFSTWMDHVPFGYDLVAELQPQLLVELGTAQGMSYFTFCQSMRENDIEGLCYAVDTWEGDEHTGKYGGTFWDDVQRHNRENYLGFSYLLRMYFKEALDQFADDSIDLLHIDGFHTYEAVAEDFASWYPKVKPGGIILFHDVRARLEGFGAWKFWDEISAVHQSFTFQHGFGLGVLRKDGGGPIEGHLQQLMFESTPQTQRRLRELYVHAAYLHHLKRGQSKD